MMKRNILYGIVLLLTSLSFFSCYDDKSTLDSDTLPEVMIDTAGIRYLQSVVQFERLKITPKVTKNGVNSDDFTYRWRITLNARDPFSEFINVGGQMHLDTIIKLIPDSQPYYLWYNVTDKTTGVDYSIQWRVEVLAQYGEGLLVADTKDGINSDLNLITAKEVTENYMGEEQVKRNIYSLSNGQRVNGLIRGMAYNVIAKERMLYIMTDHSLWKINPLDYSLKGEGDQLFYDAPNPLNPQYVANSSQTLSYVDAGKVRLIYATLGGELGAPLRGNYVIDNDFVSLPSTKATFPQMAFYDGVNGKFWQVNNLWSPQMASISSFNSGGAYDPNAVSGMECKSSGVGNNFDRCFLLKEKATSKYFIYTINDGGSTGKAKYEIPIDRGIDNAIAYVFCENQNVMYYATSTEIYAVILSGPTPIIERKYTVVESGEEITGLSMFKQGWYTINMAEDDENGVGKVPIATNNRQLIMSTYNGNEGKIYFLPLINLGTGNIDKDNSRSIGNFGRITSVISQSK